jgi:hypothetical protein
MFDKTKHIAKMRPAVTKLVNYFKSKGIEFISNDLHLDNVIFKSKDKEILISHHSFYRFSGIAVRYSKLGENTYETTEITDEIFLNDYMKPIIELHFSK